MHANASRSQSSKSLTDHLFLFVYPRPRYEFSLNVYRAIISEVLCPVFSIFFFYKLHVFTLLALITIITPFAEEIARGNATLCRCNYVIFTRVIRLALANPLTDVNISRVILSAMLKLVTGTRRYRYSSNCSRFRSVAIIPPWSSNIDGKKERRERERRKKERDLSSRH